MSNEFEKEFDELYKGVFVNSETFFLDGIRESHSDMLSPHATILTKEQIDDVAITYLEGMRSEAKKQYGDLRSSGFDKDSAFAIASVPISSLLNGYYKEEKWFIYELRPPLKEKVFSILRDSINPDAWKYMDASALAIMINSGWQPTKK